METEAEKVVRGWREAFTRHPDWEVGLRVRLLKAEAKHHRHHGRTQVAEAVEALAREVAN